MLSIHAIMTPKKSPGREKPKLCSTIILTSILFLKPRALSIPYSYVFESTSESINEYSSIDESMPKNMMIVSRFPSKNDLIKLVYLNCFSRGAVIETLVFRVSAKEMSSALVVIPR